jgi:hypothetical protein
MTVKILGELSKQDIAACFAAKTETRAELAQRYGVHQSTVTRVLVEMGVYTVKPHRVKDGGFLGPIPTSPGTPPKQRWYIRVLAFFKRRRVAPGWDE